MSDIESSIWSSLGSEDPQWLVLVTLFIASWVTVILYLLQYFQQRALVLRPGAGDDVASQEAASLLGWALSLQSWKSKWREAWCRALSDQSRKLGVSPVTAQSPLQAGEMQTHCTSYITPPPSLSFPTVGLQQFQFLSGFSAFRICKHFLSVVLFCAWAAVATAQAHVTPLLLSLRLWPTRVLSC